MTTIAYLRRVIKSSSNIQSRSVSILTLSNSFSPLYFLLQYFFTGILFFIKKLAFYEHVCFKPEFSYHG